jgi:hypothetical protein
MRFKDSMQARFTQFDTLQNIEDWPVYYAIGNFEHCASSPARPFVFSYNNM